VKRRTLLLAAVPVLACTALTAEDRDWTFMQSVGGIAVKRPYRANGKLYLPVECDVSGAKAITSKPSMINSGLVVHEVVAHRDGGSVFLSVRTALPSVGHTTACTPASLENLPGGRYSVFYGRPRASGGNASAATVKIGEFELEP
jgi:hypothetical protein